MIDALGPVLERLGSYALERQRDLASLPVDSKGRLDFVTDVDRDVERMLAEAIRTTFPDDGFLGEEGGRSPGTSGTVWVVDPIDGTHNYVAGGRGWAISVGAVRDGVPVAGALLAPADGLFLAAEPGRGLTRNGLDFAPRRRAEPTLAHIGISTWMPAAYDLWLVGWLKAGLRLDYRRTGSAATSLIAVIQGEADLYVGFGEHAWDVAGGAALAAAAGLAHTADWRHGIPEGAITFLCGRAALVEAAVAAIAEAETRLGA